MDHKETKQDAMMRSSSRSSGYGTDFPDVTSIDDVMDAIDICEKYDIPYEGLDDVDDFVERLRLHFMKESGKGSRKEMIEKSIQKAGRNDRNKREKLISVMTEMLTILHREGGQNISAGKRDSAFVESLLQREGTCEDLAMDCESKIKMIQQQECFIIVAGETSAGKSSVLNLILENEILPVHNNSSTSVITLIRYSRRKHARVVYKTDEPDVIFDLDEDGIKRLHAIAFMKSACEREHHNTKEVHVYLPLQVLKSGLVLVDTPGIGENEFLEKELINFISQNPILGFMYIIKTDNAGGVQEDRLLNLLKIVIHKQRSRSTGGDAHMKFDPKSALFVCNRFDLVDKSELDKVKQNALDKLSVCWPSFDPSQVLFFSTEKARRDTEADSEYINDNYKEFLEAVKDLYITSMERRIKFSYKWIENVLKRLVHHLKSMVKQLDHTDMDVKEKSETVRQKLEKLRDQSDNVIQELTENVSAEAKEICETMVTYFKEPYCKVKLLTCWNTDELPNVDSGLGDWDWIKMKIQETFYDRLSNIVTEWDKKENKLQAIEEDMSCLVKFKLKLLENDLIGIEKQIHGESSTDSSSDSLANLSRSRRRTGSLGLATIQKSEVLLYQPRLPTKLAGRLMKPITDVIYSIKSSVKVNEYRKNPHGVAENLANEFYKDLIENADKPNGNLAMFVESLLERPRDYITALGRKIPDMILSNQLCLNNFRHRQVEERKNQTLYESMMMNIEKLRRSLTEYGEGYIFVDDFMKGELQIQQMTPDGISVSVAFNISNFIRHSSDDLDASRRRDIRGLWTVTYIGQLVRNGLEKNIAMRVYLPSSGVEYTFKEVAKLRCLTTQTTHIAEFLGIHDADARIPAFVYGSCLKSVRRFLNNFCNKRECVPVILEQTAYGLEYLHNKGLVHMELSQDTVTMGENGEVKLSGACLPRIARLPENTESTEAGSFVYLAPEVLHGETYEATADIYSFGLFILELAQNELKTVFLLQRKKSLYEFIRKAHPETMLNLEQNIEIFTIKTRTLIQNCLEMEKLDRPAMEEVVEYSKFIRSEREALALLRSRRSRAIIKRPSNRTSTYL